MTSITDAITALPWTNTSGEISGTQLRDLLLAIATVSATLDTYLYGKAINASFPAILPTAVDAMIAFTQATNSPGSTAMRAATMNIPAPAGGDFEDLVLEPWLLAGVGLSEAEAALTITNLRAAALLLST